MGSDETGNCLPWEFLGAQKKMQIKSGVGGLNLCTQEAEAVLCEFEASEFQDSLQSYRDTLSRGGGGED